MAARATQKDHRIDATRDRQGKRDVSARDRRRDDRATARELRAYVGGAR